MTEKQWLRNVSWAWRNPYAGRTEAEARQCREQEQSRMDVETWILAETDPNTKFGPAYVKACMVGSGKAGKA